MWLKSLQPFINADQFVVRTDFGSFTDYLDALEDQIVDFFICYEDPSQQTLSNTEKFASTKLGEELLIPVVAPDKNGAPLWWLPEKQKGSIPYLHTESTLSLLAHQTASKRTLCASCFQCCL